MNFFSSGLKSVLGTQEAAQQPSGAETVERLVERVLSSTLLEDRRDACRALKSLSRKYRVEVGAHGMSAFTYVLQTDYADCEIVGYALDALCNITSDEDFDEEEWQDTNYKPGSNLGAQFTEIFIKQPDNVGLVLSFLEEYDFRVRWPAVKLLKSLLSSKPKEVQDIVLVSPMGVSKLMDLLSDSREVIRNDALLLLLQLTKGNANIQKIVAFENAFDRLFDVINDEGYADGDIVVEDCLLLMLNLLKNNVSNQNFFKEGSYIQRLAPMFNILNDDELDVGLTPQKVSNINAVLQIIRTLVSPANPGQATASCQKALRATGIVEKLCSILMAGGVPVDVLTETIITVAEVIRGNLSNQEYFASVMAPSNPPKEAIVVLLMSMVNERQPFFLRCAVLYSFQCYLYRNEMGQTKLIQTLLPSTSEQPSVTAGQLLCGGLFSHDVLSHWLSSVALSHALIENPAAKESMLRVLLTPVSSHTPLSLLHHITLLLQQSNKVQSKLGLLILLATWLSHCPPAIRHFLSIDTSISYLTTQAGATEHDDNEELVQGLCAFIMGICTHFNDDSVPSFSKENLRQLINKRVGLEVFLDKLNEVSRHEMYSRAVKHPNIRVNSPNDLLLDHEFCKLFKALEGLVMKAVTVSATDLTNGPSENIEQYKNLIREQDKRITELSMHYEALHAQNVEQAAKIQELTDQNLILKAQLSTTSAASQINQGSPHGINVVQEKDQTIARLEEELKNLRLHLENRPLSAAESQAVDSEVIYLKSQVQALQQTERELMELRKDQEDLLELVADQEREIELLKSQLRVNQEKEEDQRQEEICPIKQEPFEPSPDREEKPQPENISEAQDKPQMISSDEVHPWLLLLSKEGDLAKDFESPLQAEYQRDLKSHESDSSSPAPTPELKFDSSPVILPPTTPLSTPTPPTQISGSSRSTPNIFSPVPLPSPKPPSTGPPSPGPVTVPLSALSGESDAPVGDFSNISNEPLEVTTLPTEPIAIPKSSAYSTYSWQATSNATEPVPLSQPNSSENSASIHSPPSSTISPPRQANNQECRCSFRSVALHQGLADSPQVHLHCRPAAMKVSSNRKKPLLQPLSPR
ncbi:unnamed protein product [Bemisia tabaci]|uniref:Vesicle tethering protein Uso1/P115-like head domain-containing protein n=1 Tax=Bemisia tabaci TaxID=7038 RepID=A0A9P0F9S7_BEMTA|nr:unnamed protein product [Bemisia tabaci]